MAEKTNSAILPRGGTAYTFPDENLIKSVKPESVDENLTKSVKPEPVKGIELCRICYLNVLAKRAEAA